MAEVTAILSRMNAGDSGASEELLQLLYTDLRALAGSYFRKQPSDHTLQPTALVHEAYLKLVQAQSSDWKSRAHFMAVAATAMRQILHDFARLRRTAKRGDGWQRWTLSAAQTDSGAATVDVVAIDDALTRLRELNERQFRIVELRFLGGLDVDEIADVLAVSKSTVEKEWVRTRAWLSRELAGFSD